MAGGNQRHGACVVEGDRGIAFLLTAVPEPARVRVGAIADAGNPS
jgi:hypothetical protein